MIQPTVFDRADAISQQLPHFFKTKLRLAAYRGSNDEVLKTMAEIFSVSAKIAKASHYNSEEIHEFTFKGGDAQLERYPFLTKDHTGQMHNPVWKYAELYSDVKIHRREVKEVKLARAQKK